MTIPGCSAVKRSPCLATLIHTCMRFYGWFQVYICMYLFGTGVRLIFCQWYSLLRWSAVNLYLISRFVLTFSVRNTISGVLFVENCGSRKVHLFRAQVVGSWIGGCPLGPCKWAPKRVCTKLDRLVCLWPITDWSSGREELWRGGGDVGEEEARCELMFIFWRMCKNLSVFDSLCGLCLIKTCRRSEGQEFDFS